MSEALSPLPLVEDAVPLDPRDEALVAEVREVLERHGALGRFGLALLHRHFVLADDEILVESTDVERRVQRIEPLKSHDPVIANSIETAWRLDGPPTAMAKCVVTCAGPNLEFCTNRPHITV
jgi:hypothetical protein